MSKITIDGKMPSIISTNNTLVTGYAGQSIRSPIKLIRENNSTLYYNPFLACSSRGSLYLPNIEGDISGYGSMIFSVEDINDNGLKNLTNTQAFTSTKNGQSVGTSTSKHYYPGIYSKMGSNLTDYSFVDMTTLTPRIWVKSSNNSLVFYASTTEFLLTVSSETYPFLKVSFNYASDHFYSLTASMCIFNPTLIRNGDYLVIGLQVNYKENSNSTVKVAKFFLRFSSNQIEIIDQSYDDLFLSCTIQQDKSRIQADFNSLKNLLYSNAITNGSLDQTNYQSLYAIRKA